jgi:hypothetical protein
MNLVQERLPQIKERFSNKLYENLKRLLSPLVAAAPGVNNASEAIAAIQFAATYHTGSTDYDIFTLTMSDPEYTRILTEFFKNKGSILFSADKNSKQEWFSPVPNGSVKFMPKGEQPKHLVQPNLNRSASSSHQDWIETLNQHRFGLYSIWLTVNGLPDINWDFSLDMFLILNINLENELPPDKNIITSEDLKKWKFKEELCRVLYSFMEVAGPSIISSALSENVRQKSLKAAISQVMARNMSHNLGSHVLNNLTDEDVLINENETKQKPYHSLLGKHEYKVTNPVHLIRQLTIFNNYVKCRMDYLGDVTFGIPAMQSNIKVYGGLYKDLDRVRYLLNNISGLAENFHFDIEFQHNGIPLDDHSDFFVALPNDILGCQAFYNILENIIRNTAKHNQHKRVDEVTHFNVNFIDDIEIDPNSAEGKLEWFKTYIASLYQVEIYDNLLADPEIVNKQNAKINESALFESQLRTQSLGILEMAASAAYLRKLDVVSIDEDEFKVDEKNELHKTTNDIPELTILKAFNKDNSLGYRFFLLKPTEYLFIGFERISKERRQQLQKWGILLIGRSDFVKTIPTTVYNHQFVFYFPDTELKDLFNKYKTHLSLRKIELNADNALLQNALDSDKFEVLAIENYVWESWYKQIKGDHKGVNVIGNWIRQKPGFYNIVLLNHFQRWPDELKKKESGLTQHLEPLSSDGQRLLPNFKHDLSEYLASEEHSLLARTIRDYKLYEACRAKVLVVDERIQRHAKIEFKEEGSDIKNYQIYESSGITVPHHDHILLDVDNFKDDVVDKTVEFINEQLPQNDFLLIHYSLLERMFKNDLQKITKLLIYWSLQSRVIVTSGRGKPRSLPDEVCYLNLSPVIKVFTQTRNKYAIFNLLNQARKLWIK